jgi:hypothetical protein
MMSKATRAMLSATKHELSLVAPLERWFENVERIRYATRP